MQFRTRSRNAILLYTQGSKYVDYFALELRNGHLFYSFHLGYSALFLNTTGTDQIFSDNSNHTVSWTHCQLTVCTVHSPPSLPSHTHTLTHILLTLTHTR